MRTIQVVVQTVEIGPDDISAMHRELVEVRRTGAMKGNGRLEELMVRLSDLVRTVGPQLGELAPSQDGAADTGEGK
jgi:hypothetical protein